LNFPFEFIHFDISYPRQILEPMMETTPQNKKNREIEQIFFSCFFKKTVNKED